MRVQGSLLFLLFCVIINGNCSAKRAASPRPVGVMKGVHYVAFGDSTGAGVGARNGGYVVRLLQQLQKERPGSTLSNLCVSGATTADLVRDQLDRGVKESPELVTVGIGINDIGHNLTEE